MYSIYFVIALVVGVIDIFITIYYAPHRYNMVWIMPLAYVLFSIVFNRIYRIVGKSIVATLLLLMMTIKNIVIPFFMAIGDGSSLAVANTNEYLLYAYFVSAYELFVVFGIVYIKTPRFLNIMNCKVIERVIDKNSVRSLFRIMLVIVFVFTVIAILYPQMLAYYNYSLMETEEERIAHKQLSDIISSSLPRSMFYLYVFLFDILRWLIPTTIMFKLYLSKAFNKYMAMCLSMLCIIISAILGTDYKAASIFILISLFLILNKLYPKYEKIVYFVCLGGVLVLGFLSLVYKTYGSENIDTIAYAELANLLQAYFSGPENVAVGCLMSGYPSLEIFIGDIFKFIPFVMYFFLDFNTSMQQFNFVFFKESGIATQIIPMISQGQRYFTVLGAPIFTYILCVLAFKQEFESMKTKSLIDYCINVMLCVFLSIAIAMYCMSQCITIYFGTFLPIILILKYVKTCNRR